MLATKVGVRELKTHLSKHLRRVKAGEMLIITEYGKPIGRILPETDSVEDRMQAMVDAGLLLRTGKKLPPKEPVAVNRGPRMISELIEEDREIDYLLGNDRVGGDNKSRDRDGDI